MRLIAFALLVAGLVLHAVAVPLLAPLAPDEPAPPAIAGKLGEAKRRIARGLERRLPTQVAFRGMEHRDSDDLVILYFDLRTYPYLGVERAYLASRCRPLEEVDPRLMGGGLVGDGAELDHLRGPEQPHCRA